MLRARCGASAAAAVPPGRKRAVSGSDRMAV